MGIQEKVLERFFEKLEEDEEFPNTITEGLRKLWRNGEIASQEKILDVIRREREDVTED